MRTALLSLSLLLAPLVLVPSASAGEWCWMTDDGFGVCCSAPDPQGEPGSPTYFVTSTAESGVFTTCFTVVRAYLVADYAVECLVEGRC